MEEHEIVEEKLRRSEQIGAVAQRLNELIEDAESNGYRVYLEVAVWNGRLNISPIFYPVFDHAKIREEEREEAKEDETTRGV